MIAKFTTVAGEALGVNPATVLAIEEGLDAETTRIIVGPGLSYMVKGSIDLVINRLND